MNLYMYSRFVYHDDELVEALNWSSVVFALSIVIVGIFTGLLAAANFRSPNYHLWFNRLGNFAGLALVLFSAIVSNMDAEARIWNRQWHFYFGVGFPCVGGMILANIITTLTGLLRPERVTVAVECCIQNCGIAVSLSLSLFQGEQLAKALAVPFYYGIVECIVTTSYCLAAWKNGWTKAPADISAWKMILTSYEVLEIRQHIEEGEKNVDGFCYVDQKDVASTTDVESREQPVGSMSI